MVGLSYFPEHPGRQRFRIVGAAKPKKGVTSRGINPPTMNSLGAPLLPADTAAFIETLRGRFEQNKARHRGIVWAAVYERLASQAGRLRPLFEMERTGGEPDVVATDPRTGEYLFYDCSPESPTGRRSLCYDPPALDSRKENKPKDSAIGMAAAMGIEILTEAQYRRLQALGPFDQKTSSWVLTPPEVRALGGAVFCDRRYGRVFLYHNGAESYYASRGFRGAFKL